MNNNKLICTICTDALTALDSVYSTSCGHLYHFMCMQQWQSRSTSCPQCRQYKPETHRIYLNFESEGNDVSLPSAPHVDLETALDDESLAYQLKRSETEFLCLQAQFSKKDIEIRELTDKLEYLTIQNESRAKELKEKSTLVQNLQQQLNALRSPAQIIEPAIMTKKEKDYTLHDLFIHAKQLRGYGYKKVYKFKGMVFVREDKNSPPLRIYDLNQVDEMIESFEYSVDDETPSEESSYYYDSDEYV